MDPGDPHHLAVWSMDQRPLKGTDSSDPVIGALRISTNTAEITPFQNFGGGQGSESKGPRHQSLRT